MTIRDQDIPRFSERLRMIEEAWLRTEDELPVPALYAQGFTRGLVAGVAWASELPDREPTPEEREELANLIPLGFEARYGVWNVFESADRILAAGFRKTDREPSALRSHVRDLTGETDEGLTEVGGFRGECHDSTDNGSVAPPSDAEIREANVMSGKSDTARMSDISDTARALIEEVLDYHAGTISTHYEGCYRSHAGCLAARLHALDVSRKPDTGETSGNHDRAPIWMGEHT